MNVQRNDGGFRARRHSAEQGSPGSESNKPSWLKGVTIMAKYVFNKVNSIYPVALVLVGWCFFIGGVITVSPMSLKLFLLSVARVLP